MPRQILLLLLDLWISTASSTILLLALNLLSILFYFQGILFVIGIKDADDCLLRMVALKFMISVQDCFHSVLLVEVNGFMALRCQRTWRASLDVHLHVLFHKSDSVSKHFVGNVFIEVDVCFLDWSGHRLNIQHVIVVAHVVI